MSLPRQVLPGRSYLITRRCTQRMLLMRPDDEANNAFIYCLAVAAKRHKIKVLFTTAMSNHHHTGIYDHHGNYPAFLEHFHKLFAKCQNALRGRWENFWSSEQTSVVRLVDGHDVLKKLVYSLCNPVEAALVEHARDWPGVTSLQAMVDGKAMSARRPQHFFRPEGPMPEEVTLDIARPKDFEHLNQADWAQLLREEVAQREQRFRQERMKKGQKVLGAKKVRLQKWSSRPKDFEPRRGLNPRVAAANKWKRMEALLANKQFIKAYRAARKAVHDGLRTALFPPGTYWLKHFANVLCEDVPCAVA